MSEEKDDKSTATEENSDTENGDFVVQDNSSSDDGKDPFLVNLTSNPGNTELTKRVSFLIIPPGLGKSKSTPPYNNDR